MSLKTEGTYRDQLLRKMKNAGIPLYTETSTPFSPEEQDARQRKIYYLKQKLEPENAESLQYDASVAGQTPDDYRVRLQLELDELQRSLDQGAETHRFPSQQSLDFLLDECVEQHNYFNFALGEKDRQNSQFLLKSARQRKTIWILSCAVAFLLVCLLLGFVFFTSQGGSQTVSASRPTTSRPSASRPSTSKSSSTSEKALPLPYNGAVFYREHDRRTFDSYVAPLEIKTKGESCNYYIKMVTASGNSILEFFVRAGETAKVKMPVGTFYLRYACGSEWYGQDQYFGEDTGFFSSNEAFHFMEDGDSYSGYTLSLHEVPGGNFSTYHIDPEDF